MLTISDELASLSRADLPRLLQIIVGQARDLANAEFAAFGVVDPGGAAFSTWVFAGIAPAQARALSGPPRPVGLLGAIVSEGKTLRLGDLREHPSFGGFPPHHPAMTSFLGVPVRHGGRVVGNLY
ncbi:MAG: GAF domain-containing protein, partial [Myxococcales bacterium]|nr:GAF domain-containing protein [Myxococcales bacterium]